ncbi:hypothetical protein TrVFT333_003308 [Trichoderma virens FT-333]|nr:hypothetical protein TrVFT333_003308 [Trichoderma virens FT-333]
MCDQTVIWIGEPLEDLLPTWEMHWSGDEHDDESIDWFWKEFYSDSDRSSLNEDDSTSIDQIFHAFANLRLLSSGHLSEQPLFIDMTGEEFSYYMSYSDYCCLITDALAPFHESPWWTRVWNMRTSHDDGTNVDLWEALTTFRARHATDNRDKVHGILGLVNSWLGQPIVPNYRTTTEAIYCQAAIFTATGSQSLLPLHFPLQKHACPNLPSWCVDWTAASGLADQLNVYQWSQQPFKAFSIQQADRCHIVPHADNRILEVRGRRCDRVASVGKICQGDEPNEKRKAYCDWFLLAELHRDPSRMYRSGCSYFEAFWKCLCWDMILHMSETAGVAISSRAKGTESYEAFVGYCHSSPKSIFNPKGLSQVDREAVLWHDPRFQTTEDAKWGQYSQSDFLVEQWINGLTLNTTFFVTDSGYLGLGPPGTNVGDEVWCLFGGHMPFILRPVATTREAVLGPGQKRLHQVLGICYVHGIMNGEVTNDESIPEEVLYLA